MMRQAIPFSLMQRSAIHLGALGTLASCGIYFLIRPRLHVDIHQGGLTTLMASFSVGAAVAVALISERARRTHGRMKQANDELRLANTFLQNDNNAHQQLERALRLGEDRARELADLSSDWYWEMDEHFRYTIFSSGGRKDGPPPRFLPIDTAASDWRAHRAVLKAHHPFRNFEFKTRYKTLIGGVPVEWISASGKPIFDVDGRFKGYWGTGQNISGRKRAEEALRLSRSEICKLLAHLELVREDERKRIAREIHDDLGQNLMVLRLDISMLAEQADSALSMQKINSALQQIDATIKAVRVIINDLRPAVLDLGLHAAVDWQAKEFQRRTGIACELQIDHEEFTLDDKRVTALFRIVQESLTNIIRHAQASHVRISLQRSEGELRLQIADDGVGYVPDALRKGNRFGVIGIKERIHALGGTFSIASTPGKGMAIMLSIPIADRRYPNAARPESCPSESPPTSGGR
jgi:signal transduction histidine kinase